MPETKVALVTPWTEEPGTYEVCIKCRKNKVTSNGVMLRRRLTDREGNVHSEYKIECRMCKRSTGAHRSKLITEKEWEGKQEPEDGLKYRTRKPNKDAHQTSPYIERQKT